MKKLGKILISKVFSKACLILEGQKMALYRCVKRNRLL